MSGLNWANHWRILCRPLSQEYLLQPDVLSAVKESAAQKRDNSPGIEIINYPRTQRAAYTIAPLPFIEMNIVIFNRLSLRLAPGPLFFLLPSPFVSVAKPHFRHDLCRCFFRLARNLRTRSRQVAVSRTAATRGMARGSAPTIIFVRQNPYLIPDKIISRA